MKRIIIDIETQTARIFEGIEEIKAFTISSAANGTGTEPGSNKTPLGRLKVHKKIGGDAPKGTIFKGRMPVGRITPEDAHSNEDLITTRILWLEGAESENANTLSRYIYLHGTNQEHLLGTPASHGCIRFNNDDIIEVYDLLEEGAEVFICLSL